jgi:circadian clock protein KaiC
MGSDVLMTLPVASEGQELAKAGTGIPGLDQITEGGLPRGRMTLVTGSAGAGKTLLGVEFLVAGARNQEPGVLLTFEESAAKIAANVRSFGFDLEGLQQDGLLAVLSFQVDAAEIVTAGEFDFEPLFLLLADTMKRIGAKRVVMDTIDVLFDAFGNDSVVRAELIRLARWLEGQGVTTILTGERNDVGLGRHGIEEYASDCVIMLDHRVRDEISTRRLRVVKYRGSAHGTNEYPFYISGHGISVPFTSITLNYAASDERVSTGIDRLDHMLGGGLFRGTTALVTGTAGTGKTSLGAHLVNATCARGERALLALYEESPQQVLRNMRSLGLDLRPWVDAGLLHMWASRPSALGMETHLAVLAELIDEVSPSVAVLDGVGSLTSRASDRDVTSMVTREFDLLKSRGVTALATALGRGEETSMVGTSSMVDTWLLLRNAETNGERNRLLFVLKSRGTAHSNQVREFVLTDHGIDLIDVYVGAAGVLAGSARLAQQAAERDDATRQANDLDRRRRELRRSIAERQAHLATVQDQLAAELMEIEQMEVGGRREAADAEADRSAMATRRWADTSPSGGGPR